MFHYCSVTSLCLSNDYSATGQGQPGRPAQMVTALFTVYDCTSCLLTFCWPMIMMSALFRYMVYAFRLCWQILP
jgi:hypothetical protein